MKVVIDIPESLYKFYKTYIGSGKLKVEEDILGRLLNDGIVLTKGHGKLIDANALIMGLDEYNEYATFDCNAIKDLVDEAPTVVEADKESIG